MYFVKSKPNPRGNDLAKCIFELRCIFIFWSLLKALQYVERVQMTQYFILLIYRVQILNPGNSFRLLKSSLSIVVSISRGIKDRHTIFLIRHSAGVYTSENYYRGLSAEGARQSVNIFYCFIIPSDNLSTGQNIK